MVEKLLGIVLSVLSVAALAGIVGVAFFAETAGAQIVIGLSSVAACGAVAAVSLTLRRLARSRGNASGM